MKRKMYLLPLLLICFLLGGCLSQEKTNAKNIIITVSPKYFGCSGKERLPSPLYVSELSRTFLGRIMGIYATDQKFFHKYPKKGFSGKAVLLFGEPESYSQSDIVFLLEPEYHCSAKRPFLLFQWKLVSAPDLDPAHYTSDNVHSKRSIESRRVYFDYPEDILKRSITSQLFIIRLTDMGIKTNSHPQ